MAKSKNLSNGMEKIGATKMVKGGNKVKKGKNKSDIISKKIMKNKVHMPVTNQSDSEEEEEKSKIVKQLQKTNKKNANATNVIQKMQLESDEEHSEVDSHEEIEEPKIVKQVQKKNKKITNGNSTKVIEEMQVKSDAEEHSDGDDDKPGNSDIEINDAKKNLTKNSTEQYFGSKILVQNLSLNVTLSDVLKLFKKQCGQIAKIVITNGKLLNDDEQPQVQAFVIFKNPESIAKALELNETEFQGRQITIMNTTKNNSKIDSDTTIFVNNLDLNMSTAEIEELFSSYGNITTIKRIENIAYITFDKKESFENALELNNSTLGESNIVVVKARKRTTHVRPFGPNRSKFQKNFGGPQFQRNMNFKAPHFQNMMKQIENNVLSKLQKK